MKYKKGTQEMLDAAKDDATLLPFDTVFKHTLGKVHRVKHYRDDCCSVGFKLSNNSDYLYVDANDLLPAKKSKPKQWQNGTQAQLDAAKDDARLIPKKTYFRSKYGSTNGSIVYLIDSKYNSKNEVYMITSNHETDFHNTLDLEPIND